MDISEVDKNFQLAPLSEPDIEWFDANDPRFSLHGVFYDEADGRYRRMPNAVAETVSPGVKGLCRHTAGGRLRFRTNSPYVAVKCITAPDYVMAHMPAQGSHGFALYTGGIFAGKYSATVSEFIEAAKDNYRDMAFEGLCYFKNDSMDAELYFPLYNGVRHLYIGLKKGSDILPPTPYKVPKPLVFYGSSITQGGCASHPGNDYVSLLSRRLNFDFVNLGFSGSAKGEPPMRTYLADLDASVFVLDYDYNAPNAEHLKQTHYPLYKEIRDKKPDTPIVFISKPDFHEGNLQDSIERRKVIIANYEKAKADGDANVYFIDGETLFGTDGRDGCTVDNCHPNDLGFYRMATTIEPVLREILAKL